MKSVQATTIIDLLGGDKVTRFVGGCVRNWLAGEPVGDIDLATQLYPMEVMKRLKKAGIKVVPTGLEHGTVTAVLDKIPFEITTLRRDVETDGRHAVVSFTKKWKEDAERRDFTINTLFADLSGNVFDPLDCGISDLRKGKVVFVGNPAERIAEDYLRIMRYFRFHARYGKGAPDRAAITACEAASRNLKTLSKERVTQELLKILQVPKCSAVLKLMREKAILTKVISASYEETALNGLIKKQKAVDEVALSARLVMLAGLKRSGVRALEKELRLPTRMITRMTEIIEAVKILGEISNHSVKLSLYRHGTEATLQALYISNAPKKFLVLPEVPVFPHSGKTLMKEGFRPGPEIGNELKKREAAWIKKGFN